MELVTRGEVDRDQRSAGRAMRGSLDLLARSRLAERAIFVIGAEERDAAWAAARLQEIPGIEILAPPQLSIVAFRLAPPGAPPEELDGMNRELLDRVNAGGRVYLTATTLRGRFAIRICVLSFRTHEDRMHEAVEAIRAAADGLRETRRLP